MSALPPEDAPRPAPSAPPSLCRRGPARLHLTMKNGQCPTMRRGRVHVRAGRTLIVQLVPPHPEVKVEINVDPALHVQVTPSVVKAGDATPMYHGEYAGHLPQRVLPWPVTAKLCVVVSDGLPNPCRLMIPVTVWPSIGLMVTWWLLVFLGLIGLRYQGAIANSNSVWAVVPHIGDDLPVLGGLFLLGAPVLVVLQLLGWVVTVGTPVDE